MEIVFSTFEKLWDFHPSYGTTSQCHIFKDFPLFHRRYRCRHHLSHSTNLLTCNHHEVSPWQNRAPCSRKAPASHCRSDSDTLWILSLFHSMQRCLFPRFHLSSADRLARSSRRRCVVVHLWVRMHVVCCIFAIPRKNKRKKSSWEFNVSFVLLVVISRGPPPQAATTKAQKILTLGLESYVTPKMGFSL